jgi:hypothetical protein
MFEMLENPLALSAVCVWLIMLGAVAMSENWLRLRMPSISVPVGERASGVLYDMLDKMEIVLAAIIALSLFMKSANPFASAYLAFFIPVAVLMIQKAALMPALGRRAQRLAYRAVMKPAPLKKYHLAAELLKVASLLAFSWQLL